MRGSTLQTLHEHRLHVIAAGLVIGGMLALATPEVQAHGVPVHRTIASEAIELLNTPDLQPIYLELKTYEQSLRDGLAHEDCVDPDYLPASLNGDFNDLCVNFPVDTYMRFLHHFYRPTDGKGYNADPVPISVMDAQQDSSLIWGTVREDNSYTWPKAQSYYQGTYTAAPERNTPEWAYFALGHAVHLVQDATMPEHTHNEYHGSSAVDIFGFNWVFINNETHEKYCVDYYNDNGSLPGWPAADSTEPVMYAEYGDYIRGAAEISYHTNWFQGDLPLGPDGEAGTFDDNCTDAELAICDGCDWWDLDCLTSICNCDSGPEGNTEFYPQKKSGAQLGILGKMFPQTKYGYHFFSGGTPGFAWTFRDNDWQDCGVTAGCDGVGLWSPIEYDAFDEWWETVKYDSPPNTADIPGHYYLEESRHARPKYYYSVYRNNLDWRYGEGELLLDDGNDGNALDGSVNLAHLMAVDIIPLGVTYSAGVIRLFWNKTHSPEITILSPNAPIVSDGADIIIATRITDDGLAPDVDETLADIQATLHCPAGTDCPSGLITGSAVGTGDDYHWSWTLIAGGLEETTGYEIVFTATDTQANTTTVSVPFAIDACANFVSTATTCGVGACLSTGATFCSGGVVSDNCSPGQPGLDNDCDGVDDDCDGQNDEDYAALETVCGLGVCASIGSTSCIGGDVTDSCTPATPTGDDDDCNGIDDNCDGTEDELYMSALTTCGLGACASTGETICGSGGVLFDTCEAYAPSAATDDSCNAIDDDCDGQSDEDYESTTTTCGVGTCAATGATSCVAGTVTDSCTPNPPAAPGGDCETPITNPWTPSIQDVMNLVYCLVGIGDCDGLKPSGAPAAEPWSPSIQNVMNLVYCLVGIGDCDGLEPQG